MRCIINRLKCVKNVFPEFESDVDFIIAAKTFDNLISSSEGMNLTLMFFIIDGKHYDNTEEFCKDLHLSPENATYCVLKHGTRLPTFMTREQYEQSIL